MFNSYVKLPEGSRSPPTKLGSHGPTVRPRLVAPRWAPPSSCRGSGAAGFAPRWRCAVPRNVWAKGTPFWSTIGNSLTNKNVGMTVEMKIARDIQIWWTMVIFPFSHAISFVFVFLHPAFSQPFGGDPKSPSPASSSGAFSAAWCSISSYGDWLIEVASGCKGVWWSL